MGRGIEVVIAWGSRVLGVRTIRRGGAIGLDDLVGSLPVPGAALCAIRGPVVVFRSGAPYVVIPPDAQGWIERSGARSRSLDELHHQGHPFRSAPRPVFPPGTEVVLSSKTTVQIQLGMLTLRISTPTRKIYALRHRRAAIDRRLVACCAAAGVSLLGVLGASASLMPPLSSSVERDELQGMHHIGLMVIENDLLAEEQVVPELSLGPTDDPDGDPGEMCLCHAGGPMGCVDADVVSARYGVAGPADNPDPHIARAWAKGEIDPFEWFALRLAHAFADEAPVAPWGRDDSLGTDPVSARGNMWGETISDAKGTDDLGLASDDGGLTKVLRSDKRRADSTARSPRVTHSGLGVAGPRKPSAILPVLSSRFSRVTACYTTALATTADLSGRISLRFQIEPSGAVSHVEARSANITDSALTGCLVIAFAGLSFPAARAPSTAVTYPLLLRP